MGSCLTLNGRSSSTTGAARAFQMSLPGFQRLETDVAIIERAGRILQNYQTSAIANPSIVANGIPPTANVRGAPGPSPRSRANAPTLEERARHMTRVLAGGR
jgi:hypothetical protein